MEFNAIIFCGKGTNLSPLSAVKDTGTTKALLPIANKPMIEYSLEWCDEAPFKTITVVSDKDALPSITEYVNSYQKRRAPQLQASTKLHCISSSQSSTGSILEDVVKNNPWLYRENIVILPCDFVTNVPAQVFIELYRENSDDNLGLAISYRNAFSAIDSKILKTNYTVYAEQDNGNTVLLDSYSKSHVSTCKSLNVRTQLLWRYPATKVSTNLLDAFIFFGKAELFDLVVGGDNAKFITNRSANKIKRDVARRSWRHSVPKDTVGLVILPPESDFLRCNNLAVYLEANRYFLKQAARQNAANQKPRAKNAATVGADCIIGEETDLGERTNVKRSVLGSKCLVGKKCRISGSVLLDGVILEDDVHLENCIIGRGAKVGAKTTLVNCTIEGSYTVGQDRNLKGETLTNLSMESIDAEADFEAGETDDDEDTAVYSDDDDESFDDSYGEDDDFVFSK